MKDLYSYSTLPQEAEYQSKFKCIDKWLDIDGQPEDIRNYEFDITRPTEYPINFKDCENLLYINILSTVLKLPPKIALGEHMVCETRRVKIFARAKILDLLIKEAEGRAKPFPYLKVQTERDLMNEDATHAKNLMPPSGRELPPSTFRTQNEGLLSQITDFRNPDKWPCKRKPEEVRELLIAAGIEVASGLISMRDAREEYTLDKTDLMIFANLYNIYGRSVFDTPQDFTKEQKRTIIEEHIREKRSVVETCVKYKILGRSKLYEWKRQFRLVSSE